MKNLTGCIAILLSTMVTLAFELGKENANIFYARGLKSVATESAQLLEEVFGTRYTVKPYSDKVKAQDGIFIGCQPLDIQDKLVPNKEFIARYATDKQLFLWGRDDRRLKGSNFATYDFLEKFAGVRFLWPGELGTIAEPAGPVKIPVGLEIYQPPFDLRLTNSFTYGFSTTPRESLDDLLLWLDHAKSGRSLQSKGSGFQHAFEGLMPQEVYGKEHPEYYSLVSPENWIGEPKPAKPTRTNDHTVTSMWQLCTSNPEVRRIIAEKLAAADTDFIQSVSPNDGFMFCECEECKKQDLPIQPSTHGKWPDLTNRMYNFLRDVAAQAQKLNPKTRVGLFSYSFFAGVPSDKTPLPNNIYLSLCYEAQHTYNPATKEAIANQILGLGSIGGKVIGREYWGTHYYLGLPVNHSRKIDENLKLLYQAKAAGIYGETGESFATRATDLYILSRLSWDPTLKREDILHDFCNKAFGAAANEMYDYFEWVEDQFENFRTEYYKNPPANPNEYSKYSDSLRCFTILFDAKYQAAARAKLQAAKKLAKNADQKARVQYFIYGIDYVKVMINSVNAFMELAAAGINMPLIQPSDKAIEMEKANLMAVAKATINAENARDRFLLRYLPEFVGYRHFYSNSLMLRPWRALAESAVLDLLADRYNYLVNGAFEFRNYSWEIKGDYAFNNKINHDADNNYMVQCHVNQGVSLETTLKPGAETTITQLRPVVLTKPGTVSGSLWIRSAVPPLELLQAVKVNGVTLSPVWVNRELVTDNWHEIRFKPAQVPAGKYTFTITLKNSTKELQVANLDDLRLLVK